MTENPAGTVTRLLAQVSAGEQDRIDDLWSLVYEQLHEIAQGQMANEAPGGTLQPTALLHEAYFRLLGSQDVQWDGRAHFYGAVSQAMRRILVEQARRQVSSKRGGGCCHVPLDSGIAEIQKEPSLMLALDASLQRLEQFDPRMSDVVKFRFFAGLSVEQTSAALNVSPRTVIRDWIAARAWLYKEIERIGTDESTSRDT